MQIPLDESLGERDFDGEFDALPMSDDVAADLARARHVRRVSQRRHVLAAGILGAVLVVLGVAVLPSLGVQPATPAGPTSTGATSPLDPRSGSCAAAMRLVSSAGASVGLGRTGTPTLEVRVGDVVRLTSDGPCTSGLRLVVQSDSMLEPLRDLAVRASRTGSTQLSVWHLTCTQRLAAEPGCRGGLALDGQVTVVISD